MKKLWMVPLFASLLLLGSGGWAEAGALKGENPGPARADRPAAAEKAGHRNEAPRNYKTSGAAGPLIEVGLLSGQKEVQLRCLSDAEAEAGGKTLGRYKKGETLSVSRSGKEIVLNGKKKTGPVYLRGKEGVPAFAVKGNSYRGSMKLIPSAYAGGVTVVNALPLEEYLLGVVPSEVSPSWHEDALRAQAVAARTYAVYHKDGYRSAGYDVTDDTRSQVYRGVSVESAASSRAVRATSGEVVTYGGRPIEALFHASGGGYTENSENVWGSAVPYLRGVAEEPSPEVTRPWTKTVSLSSFEQAAGVGKLKKIGLSQLKKGPVKAKDRGVSGRVLSIALTGNKGKKTLSGSAVQSLFGLPSTLFDLQIKGKQVVITGYGSGHGLGLSQWGAEAMAARHGNGKDYYKTILSHYFTGTKVEKIY